MIQKIKKVFASLSLGLSSIVLLTASAGAATTYLLYGDATELDVAGNTVVETVSDSDPGYGGIDFDVSAGTTFADLTTLSTDFNVTDDNCGGGSPRFQLNTSSGNIFVYLGDYPGYNTCTPNTWEDSGDLLETGMFVDTSQVGGTFYDTYDNALALYGGLTITGVQLVTDAGWVSSGEQTVLFDNVNIGGTVYDFEPAVMPVSKDDCKKGGWEIFGIFKNQGDCVSFVATGGRNKPANNPTF